MLPKSCYILLLLFLLHACKSHYQASQVNSSLTTIKGDSLVDSMVFNMIVPYKHVLDSQMNMIIGFTENDLTKNKPESTLGNLFADAAMSYCQKHYEKKIDACVINYGTIRLPVVPKGAITQGEIFELMPFEDELVVLEISGATLQQLLQLTAVYEGWPVNGITMQIQNKKVMNILVANNPLDTTKIYTLATNNYIANGGDNAFMLKSALNKYNLNYKFRDAIADYIKDHNPLILKIEGRVTKTN